MNILKILVLSPFSASVNSLFPLSFLSFSFVFSFFFPYFSLSSFSSSLIFFFLTFYPSMNLLRQWGTGIKSRDPKVQSCSLCLGLADNILGYSRGKRSCRMREDAIGSGVGNIKQRSRRVEEQWKQNQQKEEETVNRILGFIWNLQRKRRRGVRQWLSCVARPGAGLDLICSVSSDDAVTEGRCPETWSPQLFS